MSTLYAYYRLAKPGMIYGNILPLLAGFCLAARGALDIQLLLLTMLGTALIIGSACVYNNVIDRDIDAKMDRTRDRAIVRGTISPRAALIYATTLGVLGTVILALFTNTTATVVALFGLFAYVFLYSLWGKRHTHYGTLIGSLSGATPPVIGYCAVTGSLDSIALLLFLILAAWQMPHFYAIAVRRQDEFAAAGLPVLPITHGLRRTKIEMVLYIIAFSFLTTILGAIAGLGTAYRVIMIVASSLWLFIALRGFSTSDDIKWARRTFHFSLVVLVTFSLTVSIASIISG